MIDLHTHTLPGIDDGPPTVDDSITLARTAADAGITTLVATPHVSWRWENTAQTIATAAATLEPALAEAQVGVRIRTGAELEVARAVGMDDDELRRLRLGGGEWLLLECPLAASAPGFDAMVLHLAERGHRVVLAHPERSPTVRRSPKMLRDLVRRGMVTQVTAGALTGQFGRTTRQFALELLSEGLVHNLASDAHDALTRPPGMRWAMEETERDLPGLLDLAEWLCHDVPRAILDGGEIPRAPAPPPTLRARPEPEPPPRKRSLLDRLARRG